MNKIKQTIQLLLLLLLAQLSVVAGAQERVTYIHTDALGSPIAASDEDGNLIWRESYQPYGKRLRLQKGSDCPWYTGKYEEEIGLVYYGKRWYNPEIGRFYSVDPVRFDESNIHSFNRYAYANNNPYKFVDPDGEEPLFFVVFHKGTTINQAMERSEPFRRSLDVGGTLVYGVGAAIDAGSDVLNPVKGGVKQIVKRATKRGLKNASGNLDDAARAARTQPYQREITQHANQRLQTRDKRVTNDALETAITRGQRNFDPATGKTVHNLPASQSPTGRGVTTVTNHRGGVITVIDKGRKFDP